jgi:hypothetical protein
MGGWHAYWKRKNHKPKKLCSELYCLDSFAVFSEKLTMVSDHVSRVYALLNEDGFSGTFAGAPFFIKVSKQKCHFGGFRCFFHCSHCSARMRKVYFSNGRFECRKCLNLGYFSQRLKPCDRFLETMNKVKNSLISRNGGFNPTDKRPRRMWNRTYSKIQHRISELYWKASKAQYMYYSSIRNDKEFQKIFEPHR